jgi:predicted amidohydrolase
MKTERRKSGSGKATSTDRAGGALRIGLAQVKITMGDKPANCRALLSAVAAAAKRGCDVVVLPECGFAGWLSEACGASAEPIPGPFTDALQRAARAHRIAVVAGIEERADGCVYNSAVFIDENGELRATHRKVNELDLARSFYSTGTSIVVTNWRGHSVGILICADCWRPELVDALWLMGADLILSPCAWAVEPGGESTNLAWILETYRQRIGERGLIIAAANGVGEVTEGPWRGRCLQGNSLFVSRDGLAQGATNKKDLLVVDARWKK